MSQSFVSNIIFKMQAMLWFLLAVGLSIVWFFLWITTDVIQAHEKQQKEKISLADAPLPTYIESYVQMTKEVPPIDFATVVRDLRNYPAEFKDKKHFEKDAKRWTVQVMNVSSNDIITEYLNHRADREKFAYFRYHNTNDELRYILTYGTMNSAQEALSVIKTMNFGLPDTVKFKPEEIGYYIRVMDQYERGDNVIIGEALNSVNLTPAKREVAAAVLTSAQLKNNMDNKFQNAVPTLPSTPNTTSVPNAFGTGVSAYTNSNTQTANPQKPTAPVQTQPNKEPATPKHIPQESVAAEAPEVVIDMSVAPKTPAIQKAPPAESNSSVTYTQNNDVMYEAPKSTVRPNTNTNSIPGADRD